MGRFVDLTGKRFGRWTVIGRAESRMSAGKPVVFWKCKCDCGTEKDVNGHSLRDGKSVSCGCFHKEQLKVLGPKRRKKKRIFRFWRYGNCSNARRGYALRQVGLGQSF